MFNMKNLRFAARKKNPHLPGDISCAGKIAVNCLLPNFWILDSDFWLLFLGSITVTTQVQGSVVHSSRLAMHEDQTICEY